MERIFISYKRIDKDRVLSIKNNIEKNVGVGCWIDLDGIESDAQFANVIINAINNAEVFLFMYSYSHSKIVDYDTDWTVREINFAQKKKKRIVFINLDGTSLTDWKKAAEQGDSRAQYALGVMYKYSRGVVHDIEEAKIWYKKAAEQGHLGAQKELEQ